jgi:hypothetical protein
MPDRNGLPEKCSQGSYITVIKQNNVNNTDLRKENKGQDPIVKFRIPKI